LSEGEVEEDGEGGEGLWASGCRGQSVCCVCCERSCAYLGCSSRVTARCAAHDGRAGDDRLIEGEGSRDAVLTSRRV